LLIHYTHYDFSATIGPMKTSPLLKLQDLAMNEKPSLHASSYSKELFFIIKPSDDNRYYLENEDLTQAVPSSEHADLLWQIQSIKQSKSHFFSWKEKTQLLFIDEYPGLFTQLREKEIKLCFKNKQTQLSESRKEGRLSLKITKTDSNYEPEVIFTVDEQCFQDTIPLGADCIMADKILYTCRKIGPRYNHLTSIKGRIPEKDLESFMTLFISLYPDVEMNLQDYSWKKPREGRVEPGLRFDSLTNDGALQISSCWCYDDVPLDFMTNYHPSSVVKSDHEKQTLTRISLSYPEEQNILSQMSRTLKKITKESGSDEGFILEEDTLFISPELAIPLLTKHISSLASRYRLFGSEHLKKLKLRHVNPEFHFTPSSGIDYFEGPGTLKIDNEHIPLETALKLYDEHGYIPLNDSTKALIDASYFKILRKLVGQYNKKQGTWKISLFDMPLMDQLISARISGAGMNRSRKIFEGFNSLNKAPLPEGAKEIKTQLRSYQSYGVKWMAYLRKHSLGGCLADDMGLGKTIQALTMLCEHHLTDRADNPSLVIMPRSLLHNWKKEIEKFAPRLKTTLYYGTDRNLETAMNSQVILTTYALIRNDLEQLKEQHFAYVILDEAQAIKNSSSRISKAVTLLRAEHRLAISGTPVENSLNEVFALFRFLNPAMFGQQSRFNKDFLNPIQKNGDEEALKILAGKIAPFLLRRLKHQVATELPERTEQIIYVDMNSEQTRIYEERRLFYEKLIHEKLETEGMDKSRFLILQGLLELRQLASVPESKTEGAVMSAKWDILLDHLEEVISEGHRCLVFTNFLNTLEIMEEKLTERKCTYLSMSGATRNRAELVEKFQNSEHFKVFLMTLKTGGVGLNLTEADYVYILDPWWNYSAEQQAIDRTHRIGQKRNVFCYRLISRGTIEEKILELQEKKKELVSSVITSDGQSFKMLSPEDINYMLRRDS